MIQVFGSLLFMWKVWMEFISPGFRLTLTWLGGHLGASDRKISVYLSLCISNKSIFYITLLLVENSHYYLATFSKGRCLEPILK